MLGCIRASNRMVSLGHSLASPGRTSAAVPHGPNLLDDHRHLPSLRVGGPNQRSSTASSGVMVGSCSRTLMTTLHRRHHHPQHRIRHPTLVPPRPTRFHPGPHRQHRHHHRHLHLHPVRRDNRHHRDSHHQHWMGRRIPRQRNRLHLPPSPLLRPSHRTVPH